MRSLPGAYDEASSGSDDDDSSVEHEPVVTTKQRRRELEGRQDDDDDDSEEEGENSDRDNSESSEDSDSDSDSDSDGESSESNSDSGSDNDNDKDDDDEEDSDKEKQENANDSGSDSEDQEEDSDDPELPLHERIRRREQKGLSMTEARQRKAKALEAAVKKLARFQKDKRKQQQEETGNDDDSSDDEEGEQRPRKRAKSKHAPTEVSSKRKDFFRRGAPKLNESGLGVEIGANRYKPLDPRVSNLSGHFNEDQFSQNYQFLQTIRNQEIKKLKLHIAARKLKGRRGQAQRQRLGITNKGSLEEDQEKLKELQQAKADWERKQLNRDAKRAVKQKLKTQVEEKGQVYYLKRKEKRMLELEAKMDLIRKTKGQVAVDKAINKRRKKQKSKDSKIFAR